MSEMSSTTNAESVPQHGACIQMGTYIDGTVPIRCADAT